MLDFNDIETYLLLVKICNKYDADPSVSIESEEFFKDLLSQYSGPLAQESVEAWLEEQIQQLYISVGARPKWIQGSEWPFANGKPMIFVGQIDLFSQEREIINLFHDDTSLYVFIGKKVEPVVILQQY